MHKIIDILVPMSGRGGVENVINAVSEKLLACGCRVRIVQMVYSGMPWVQSGAEFYPILTGGHKVGRVEEFVDLYASFLASRERPDVVLATPWPFMSYAARAALNALDFMERERSAAAVTPNVSESAPRAAAEGSGDKSAHHGGSRVVAWLHAPVETYKQNGTGGIECLSFADGVFVLSDKVRNKIVDALPDAQVDVVRNPVDMTGIEPVAHWNRRSGKLLFVGRLSEEKRLDVVIRALSLTGRHWNLTVTGAGEKISEWKTLAETVGVSEYISWSGWKENPWEDFEDVTALVMASDYEGFGLVALEALARGIPVISTPTDGALECVKPGVNGYLFECGSSEGLAEILDAIDAGVLPDIQPENCVESVSRYERQAALADFVKKLGKY